MLLKNLNKNYNPTIRLNKNFKRVKFLRLISTSEKQPKKTKGLFRLSSKTLFLTFSDIQVDILKYPEQQLHKEIIRQLKTKKEFKIDTFLICIELHKNNVPHAHVLLNLRQRCDTVNPRALDLKIEEKDYHGEYEVAKNKKKAVEYIIKNGNYYTDMKNFEVHEGNFVSPEEKAFHQTKTIGMKKALENYVDKYPDRALTKLSSLKTTLKNLEWVLKPEEEFIEPKFNLENLKYKNPEFKIYLKFLVKNNMFNRTPIIFGKGGNGKTVILKALMKALKGKKLYIRNIQQAINLRDEHDVLGYDEFKIKDFDDEDFINLLDQDEESGIRVLFGLKHKKKGLQVILGTNRIKKITSRDETLEAILRRSVFIRMDEKTKVEVDDDVKEIQIEFGDDFKFEEHIENFHEYKKYHHYSNDHPLTIRNYKILGLMPPKPEKEE